MHYNDSYQYVALSLYDVYCSVLDDYVRITIDLSSHRRHNLYRTSVSRKVC